MPAGWIKNKLYHLGLPFLAPRLEHPPLITVHGHPFNSEKQYQRLIERNHVLGSACLIAADDQKSLLFSSSHKPYHSADKNTFFRTASITKTATALCALKLCAEGFWELDEPISHYFDLSDHKTGKITLRQLLSHTSGLIDPPYLESAILNGTPFSDFLEHCISDDTSFHYSNLGFGLIGSLMETVTNLSVQQVFTKYLFQPFHITASLDVSTIPQDQIMPIARVLPYRTDQGKGKDISGKKPLSGPDPLHHYGYTSGSMYIRIEDLFKLFQGLQQNGNPLIEPKLKTEMLKTHAHYGKLSPTLSYGLGLLIIQDSALSKSRILGHQGFAYGCANGAFWEEDTGHTVLFLNGGCSEERIGRMGRCNRELLKLMLRKEFPLWQSSAK